MAFNARPYVLHEANLHQLDEYKPNVAVMPWGATEGHGWHLPYGTDVIEGTALGELACKLAYEQGGRPILLPTVPFGIDHTQLYQHATITMRASTQQAVLRDVAESLVRQGIDRLILVNFHGGNDFKSMIRDVMLDLPIFILQVHGFLTAPFRHLLEHPNGDHADEFETSFVLHLHPDWVDMSVAGDGATCEIKLKTISNSPAAWVCRDWKALTPSTGVGDPRQATADKGKQILELLAGGLAPMIVELSKATLGDFPYVRQERPAF